MVEQRARLQGTERPICQQTLRQSARAPDRMNLGAGLRLLRRFECLDTTLRSFNNMRASVSARDLIRSPNLVNCRHTISGVTEAAGPPDLSPVRGEHADNRTRDLASACITPGNKLPQRFAQAA